MNVEISLPCLVSADSLNWVADDLVPAVLNVEQHSILLKPCVDAPVQCAPVAIPFEQINGVRESFPKSSHWRSGASSGDPRELTSSVALVLTTVNGVVTCFVSAGNQSKSRLALLRIAAAMDPSHR